MITTRLEVPHGTVSPLSTIPTDTCQPALVAKIQIDDTLDMTLIDQHSARDITVAWCVAIGVGAAGIYDFQQGRPPKGAINLDPDAALILFLAACAATIVLTKQIGMVESQYKNIIRRLLLIVSSVPALLADPTYSCLLIAISLMDVRRRDSRHVRTALTLVILSIVAVLLVTEDTPRITAEFEAMIGVGIAFMIITMLGDTFRHLDQGIVGRTELAQLRERMRIADELHDSVGHHLLAASVQLQKATATRVQDPHGSGKSVDLAQQAISEAIADTRLIVSTMRDNRSSFSVEASIRSLIKRVSTDPLNITLDMQGDHETLDQPTQLALYRVVQEALSNIVRHSASTRAQILCVIEGEQTKITIADNGCGFTHGDITETGGLLNMTRRIEHVGGTLDIDSNSSGTSIIVSVPR